MPKCNRALPQLSMLAEASASHRIFVAFAGGGAFRLATGCASRFLQRVYRDLQGAPILKFRWLTAISSRLLASEDLKQTGSSPPALARLRGFGVGKRDFAIFMRRKYLISIER